MAKIEVLEFDPVIYPFKFWVAKNGTKADIKELFVDDDREELLITDKEISGSRALTFDRVIHLKDGMIGALTWLHTPKGCSDEEIAHESDHLANALYDHIGASVDPKNDEPHAYLVGFAAKAIGSVLRGKS